MRSIFAGVIGFLLMIQTVFAAETPIYNLRLQGGANGAGLNFTNLNQVVALYFFGNGSGITGVVSPGFTNWLGTNTYIKVEVDPEFTNWISTNGYVKIEVDPEFTNWIGTNGYVKVEVDPAFTNWASTNTYIKTAQGGTNGIGQVLGNGTDANGQSIFNLEYIYDQNASGSRVAIRQSKLHGSNNVLALDWQERKLIGTNGSTVALDWSTGDSNIGTNALILGTNSIALYGGVLNGTNGLFFIPGGSTNRYWILGGN